MDTSAILEAINLEILRLEQARSLLADDTSPLKRVRPKRRTAVVANSFAFGTNVALGKERRRLSAGGGHELQPHRGQDRQGRSGIG
jgi:hypothetical protein